MSDITVLDETVIVTSGEAGPQGAPADGAGSSGGAPSGAAGGVLAGSYPNPTFAQDMATQSELNAEAAARAAADTAEASARATADALRQLLSEKDQPGGYAGIQPDGHILSSILPSIAITDVYVVGSQAAMLALPANQGDVAIRTDLAALNQPSNFILATNSPGTLADWKVLPVPADAVSSVNTRSGAVTGLAEQADLTAEIARATSAEATLILKSVLDANTVLVADNDDTPVARVMGPSTILARLATGGIIAATPAQLKTLLAIAASDVSGFDTQVRTSRLDQMAAPTTTVSFNSQRAVLLADPVGNQDAATKAYVLAQIAALVNSAPGILDTLGEIATQLQADESTAAALATTVAGKIPLSTVTAADDLIVGTGAGAVTNLAVAASRIIGKKATGGTAALTPAEVLAILNATEHVAPDFKATGKTGATAQPLIIAGGTASGAPTSGTHEAGELIYDALGYPWYCTVAGTPGTWICVASGRTIGTVSGVGTNTTTSTSVVDLPTTPLAIALPQLPIPVRLHFHASPGGSGSTSSPSNNTAGDGIFITIVDGSATSLDGYSFTAATANALGPGCDLWAVIAANTAAQTVKVQMQALTGGTARLAGVGTRPLLFEAIAA